MELPTLVLMATQLQTSSRTRSADERECSSDEKVSRYADTLQSPVSSARCSAVALYLKKGSAIYRRCLWIPLFSFCIVFKRYIATALHKQNPSHSTARAGGSKRSGGQLLIATWALQIQRWAPSIVSPGERACSDRRVFASVWADRCVLILSQRQIALVRRVLGGGRKSRSPRSIANQDQLVRS